ncbi:hypothetical protein K4K60_002899 [Colletotrichum sp. SAR11_57]|nr:hypothetical protein K4K60_002899 [Colletotrichum sp. SAR11_57]
MREGPGITDNKRYAEHSDLDAAFEPCHSYSELQAEGSQYWFVQDGDSVYFESFFPQLDASDLRDQNIKSLSIYEDVNPTSQRPWSQHSRRHPRRVVGESLGPISLFLEKLSASYIIEANDFFRKTQSDWVWENLTSLTLTSELLAEDACHLRATNMLANAAGAALQMPRLQRMEIWYGGFRTAALFRYAVSESGTSIRWHGTWELQLQRRLVDAWRAVAALHTANELVVHQIYPLFNLFRLTLFDHSTVVTMRISRLSLATLASSSSLATALADGLTIALTLDRATQGICISSDGRKFLTQRYSTTDAPQAVELLSNGTTVLYPDSTWNSWTSNSTLDPKKAFVSIDGARIGPDGRFWVVDGGTTDSDGKLVSGSSKLAGVNLTTNAVDKVYYLDNLTETGSVIDDVRFNGNVAYLSDTAGALVVMDLTTGEGKRVLVGHSSAVAWFPMAYNGSLVPGYQGGDSTLSVGLDQIEVSPDGVYLYYQPCNGGMYRIETQYVDGALTNSTLAENLGDYAVPFALTPSTGGTTIDGDGNIYVSDTNLLAIWKVKPDGSSSILVQDDALVWTDLMWVDADKNLWLPASQMRPGANGLMADGPNYIFTYPIDAGPSPIDHA